MSATGWVAEMARIRTVKPDFFDSGTLAKISRNARLTFVGLFTLADDEGRLRDLPKKIAGELFPYDDDVTAAQITTWLDELASVGSLVRYSVRGDKFMAIPSWRNHQKIDHPTASRIPAPPEVEITENSQVALDFYASPETLANDSREIRESFAPDLGKGKGSGKGVNDSLRSKIENDFLPAVRATSDLEISKDETTPDTLPTKARPQRKRDELFEATLEACGIDWPALVATRARTGKAPSALGAYNRAVAELRGFGATPEQVRQAVPMLNATWKEGVVTPSVLARRWPELQTFFARHAETSRAKSGINPLLAQKLMSEELADEWQKGMIEV